VKPSLLFCLQTSHSIVAETHLLMSFKRPLASEAFYFEGFSDVGRMAVTSPGMPIQPVGAGEIFGSFIAPA
jgi:hypothetical protein